MLPVTTWYASGQLEHDVAPRRAVMPPAATFRSARAFRRIVAGSRRALGHGLIHAGRLIAAEPRPRAATRSAR